jgi:hypothetical protein
VSVMDIGEPNPITARVCAQTDIVSEDGYETEHEETCGRNLVFEKHGDEVVYMCTEHGWQATVFEQGSDSDAPTP